MSTDSMTADFKAFQDKVLKSVVALTRNVAAVTYEDLGYHCNTSGKVSKAFNTQNQNLLSLTSDLLKAVVQDTNMTAPILKTQENVEDSWKPIVDVVDNLLEKSDVYIDEYNGGITRNKPQSSTPEPAPSKPRAVTTPYHHPYTGNMAKPQKFFNRKVDNFDTSTWKPLLLTKPHAVISLQDSLVVVDGAYKHPYEHEIQQYKYPERVYRDTTPIDFTSPEENAPIWIDTEQGVRKMLEELKLAKEIAVDLEHNDRNSYVGLVSLMQISTREKDWVIDTLKPWRENLQVLNEVFTDPAILKVFHGSASDMVWLQRDLGLYVVGLFDTYWAATALHYKSKSLAYLLSTWCDFTAQKYYQTADWRIRPLPQEHLDYARSDTHYLLYIYDNMRNELVQASNTEHSLVDDVLRDSKQESLQVYERRPYDQENGLGSEGWLKILAKMAGNIDKQQFGVLKALHAWRDQKAREADEGPGTIMAQRFLIGCAERPPQAQSQLYNPPSLGKASHWVTSNPAEIMDVIHRGKREGGNGPSVQEVLDRNTDQLAKLRRFYTPRPDKSKNVQPGVAETMRNLVSSGAIINGDGLKHTQDVSGTLVGRLNLSSLWGSTRAYDTAAVVDVSPAEAALESIRPVRSFANILTPDADETIAAVKTTEHESGLTNGEARVVYEPDIDVSFTLRSQNARKRRAESIDEDDDVVSTDVQHSDKFAITDEGKVTRYSDARRAFKSRDNNKQDESASFEPFDYANAQSILHAKVDGTTTNGTVSGVKALNPFAKSLDTTTGAKRNRMGKELAGRSHTFKS